MYSKITNKESIALYLIGFYPFTLILGTLISEILNFTLIILFVVECIKNKNTKFFKDPIIYFLIIIWIYLIVNLFSSVNYQLSLNRSIFFIRYPLLILAISYFLIKYPKKIEIIFTLWMITLIITIVDLYIQYFLGENILGFKSPWNERLSGFFNQELKVAHLLIGFFLPTFAFFLNKNPKNYFLYIILILYFIILVLTNERANIIRGSFALILFFIFIKIYKFKFKIFLLFLIASSLILLVNFADPIKQRFINEIKFKYSEFKNTNESDTNIKIIYNFIKYSNYGPHFITSFEIFKKNKILGTGIKTFRQTCNDVSIVKYYPKNISKTEFKCSTHPHQYYFEILSDLGLIGIILFLSFFGYLLFRIINSYYYTNNLILLSTGVFFVAQLIPFLPTGSFFTSFGSTIFFVNISLIFAYLKKK